MEEAEYKDFIGIYHNVFSEDWCNLAIKSFEYYDKNNVTYTRQESGQAQHRMMDKSINFPIESCFDVEYGNIFEDFIKTFKQDAWPDYLNKNWILKTSPETFVKTVKLQRTKPGQGYHIWHIEHSDKGFSSRVAAWILYLNDDFEAGETEFLMQERRVSPKTGTLVIWPAGYTHVHRGNPPIGGDKYIATGWIEY